MGRLGSIDLGFNPCPKCGRDDIDYGKVERPPYKVYAECRDCGYIRWAPIYEDTYHALRLADVIRISRDAWNDRHYEGE